MARFKLLAGVAYVGEQKFVKGDEVESELPLNTMFLNKWLPVPDQPKKVKVANHKKPEDEEEEPQTEIDDSVEESEEVAETEEAPVKKKKKKKAKEVSQ